LLRYLKIFFWLFERIPPPVACNGTKYMDKFSQFAKLIFVNLIYYIVFSIEIVGIFSTKDIKISKLVY